MSRSLRSTLCVTEFRMTIGVSFRMTIGLSSCSPSLVCNSQYGIIWIFSLVKSKNVFLYACKCRGRLQCHPANSRRARLRGCDTGVTRMLLPLNPPLCVIIVYGGLKTHKVRVEENTRCFQYTASPVQTSRPPKRWLCRNARYTFPTER